MTKTITTGILCAASAFAQSQADRIDKLKAELQAKAFIVSSERLSEATITGAPYLAEETTTTTQTLFDGNRIVNGSTTKVFRDQQGRTRVESSLSNIGSHGTGALSITISDPVSSVSYTIDPDSKTAYKFSRMNSVSIRDAETLLKMKGAMEELAAKVKSISIASSAGSAGPARSTRHEDLGTSNMAGVPVKGTRSTQVIPAGTMGNDRDINIVDERWYSPDLKMNIMTKHSDPRSGETVFQVTNLTRANPDPSLFQVPADYQIKEGAHDTIRLSTPKE